MRILPLLLLAGCLGPDVQTICVENTTSQRKICDVELDANAREEITQQCAQQAGYVRGIRCAQQSMALYKCNQEVLATNPNCDDLDNALDDCAYERGIYNGCLARDN